MSEKFGFTNGIGFVFSSFGFIKREEKIKRYIAIPIAVNILLFLLGFLLLWFFRVDIVELVWAYPEDSFFMSLIWYVFAVLVFGIAMLLSYFLFTPLGCMIASPFNDALSGRTEQIVDPDIPIDDIPVSFSSIAGTISKEVLKVAIMLLILAFGAILNIIPGIGTILGVIVTFGGGSWFIAIEYFDYPMSRHGKNFKELYKSINANLSISLGFGLAGFVLLMIPLVNLVCIPVCVVAASRMFVELNKAGKIG